MLLSTDDLIKRQNLEARGIKVVGLRKVRSRMILEVLLHGACDPRGNCTIIAHPTTEDGEPLLEFSHRGTPLCAFFVGSKVYMPLDAQHFEGTASTTNQRELIKQAITEVFGEVIM